MYIFSKKKRPTSRYLTHIVYLQMTTIFPVTEAHRHWLNLK